MSLQSYMTFAVLHASIAYDLRYGLLPWKVTVPATIADVAWSRHVSATERCSTCCYALACSSEHTTCIEINIYAIDRLWQMLDSQMRPVFLKCAY